MTIQKRKRQQAARNFRNYYSGSASIIKRYHSGRDGNRHQVRFICHKCGQETLIRWTPYRWMYDLLCTKCLQASLKERGFFLNSGRSSEDKKWDRDLKKRADGRCELTGKKGKLVVHHLQNYHEFPKRRTDFLNGVVILRKIHNAFHAKYGKKTNSTQFAEFVHTL